MADKPKEKQAAAAPKHEGTPSSIALAEAEQAPEEERAAVYEAAKKKARWG